MAVATQKGTPMPPTAPDAQGAQASEPPRRKVSLAERAYVTLEEEIVTLRRPPGNVLSEAQLASDLGMGRTPVREALQRLSEEGLVTVLPQRGVLVSQISQSSYIEMIEVRRPLERTLAALAARRATPEQRARFGDMADGFAQAAAQSDLDAFMTFDRDFNVLLKTAAQNTYGAAMMRLIQAHSRRFFFRYRDIARLEETATLHEAMARAICDGDADRAAAACDDLMNHNESFARESLRTL